MPLHETEQRNHRSNQMALLTLKACVANEKERFRVLGLGFRVFILGLLWKYETGINGSQGMAALAPQVLMFKERLIAQGPWQELCKSRLLTLPCLMSGFRGVEG